MISPIPDPRPLTPESGFTLIEITVTLFLVGIFLSLFLPKLPDVTGYRLKSHSRKLANIIKYIRNRSIVEKNVFRLNYNIDRGEYWVDVLRGDQFVKYESVFSSAGSLDHAIKFEEIFTSGAGKRTRGKSATHFSTQGFVENTTIHLSDNRKRKYTLFVQPLTGRVTIHEGYVEKKFSG